MSFDPQQVRDFEHAGWQSAAGRYGATFARATSVFIDALLDAAGIAAGEKVLDVACGPGIVTAAASRRGARAEGLDFSAAMVALARAGEPQIAFAEGDAEALPFAEGRFDAVVSNFGIHHVAQPERALREAHRVLRRGGRVAFTSWAAPQENVAWKLLFEAIAMYGDPNAAKAPPPGGALRDVDAVSAVLREAGFEKVEARQESRAWAFAEPADLVEGFRRGTVRTAALLDAQPKEALPAIEEEIARRVLAYRSGSGYAVPIVAILGRASKA